MPQGDQTGPAGQGPMTGRRRGFCAGFNAPGYANGGFGRGRGIGRGFGRGRGFGWRARAMQVMPIQQPAALTEAEEKKLLEAELKEIEAEKQEIAKRLKELK
jgi:hypothetical protein